MQGPHDMNQSGRQQPNPGTVHEILSKRPEVENGVVTVNYVSLEAQKLFSMCSIEGCRCKVIMVRPFVWQWPCNIFFVAILFHYGAVCAQWVTPGKCRVPLWGKSRSTEMLSIVNMMYECTRGSQNPANVGNPVSYSSFLLKMTKKLWGSLENYKLWDYPIICSICFGPFCFPWMSTFSVSIPLLD